MSEEEITFTRKEVEEMLDQFRVTCCCYPSGLNASSNKKEIIKKYIEKKLTPKTFTLSERELRRLFLDTRMFTTFEDLNEFIERVIERIKDKFKGETK